MSDNISIYEDSVKIINPFHEFPELFHEIHNQCRVYDHYTCIGLNLRDVLKWQ